MRKKSFIFYLDYQEQLNLLTDNQIGKLIRAIFKYEKSSEIMELDEVTKMAFSFIKLQLDRDREKYIEKCAINRENGKKGGRPKKQKDTKISEGIFEEAKKADNDNKDDIESDKENNLYRSNQSGSKGQNDPNNLNGENQICKGSSKDDPYREGQTSLAGEENSPKTETKSSLKVDSPSQNEYIKNDIEIAFEEIWVHYPNKVKKAKAFKYYKDWLNGKEYMDKKIKLTHEEMLIATIIYAIRCKLEKKNKKYIQQGSTFFNLSICDMVMEFRELSEEEKEKTLNVVRNKLKKKEVENNETKSNKQK